MAEPEQPQHRKLLDESQNQPPIPRRDPSGATPDAPSGTPPIASAPVTEVPPDDAAGALAEPPEDKTIGTGSAIALGCIVGTIMLICVGLAFLVLTWAAL